ncbi:hypothetical protein N7G274_003582 [Stereocaulon virgatum]|uniref:C2H2-type domain-containing protein n=1 Tax=Stereocaulon virgatum TaxID=373712 RepID=A0ABR4AEI7_9LECA
MARIDYDNAQVRNAQNPSDGVYHHGPIPNANPGRMPAQHAAAIAAGTPVPPIIAAQNAHPPNPAASLSSMDTSVCDIKVNGATMCGLVFGGQPAFRRHLRKQHPGAITNPCRNINQAAQTSDTNAIRWFVLSRAWRQAAYLHEPGRGPVNGYLDRYATECEQIAASDPQFAATFGTHFYRIQIVAPTPDSKRKRKHEPTPPPGSRSPTPAPSPKRPAPGPRDQSPPLSQRS